MNTKVQTAKAETLSFKAEETELLHLLAHALYSNREVFLREMISNASDANHKMRLEALQGHLKYDADSTLKIWVDVDKEARTITVRDNGIGMSRNDLVEGLGTIALSGTKKFLKKLSGDKTKDAQLIGQFGVGFYSGFVVADRITVRTLRAGLKADQAIDWSSDGKGKYTLKACEKTDRGTEVILHLKADKEMDNFLEDWELRQIIHKYSDHIVWPIVMKAPVIQSEEDEGETDASKGASESTPKEPEIKEEIVNQNKALWLESKQTLKDKDYQAFYKHVTGDFSDALAWAHNRVEGKLEYTSLLYIPKKAPFDLWNMKQHKGVKLYVQRTFIMEDADQFLPVYMRFVRGIIDCNDLPLNVSRELLQDNKVVRSIRTACVKRLLDLLEDLSAKEPAQYQTFWNEFGQVLKEGPAEDYNNRTRIAKLLRFASTHSGKAEQTVTFVDYVSRMKAKQDVIYYVTAETFMAAKHSPHLEVFEKQGIEVLLLHDRIDEWLVTHLSEFEGKRLQSIAKGDLDVSGLSGDASEAEAKKGEAAKKKLEEQYGSFLEQVKKVLGDRVKEVRLTDRLVASPACLIVEENEMSAQMVRLLKQAGQAVPDSKPILELNPKHKMIKHMHDEQDEKCFAEWTHLLFDQAQLTEGAKLDDPTGFVHRMNQLMSRLMKGN